MLRTAPGFSMTCYRAMVHNVRSSTFEGAPETPLQGVNTAKSHVVQLLCNLSLMMYKGRGFWAHYSNSRCVFEWYDKCLRTKIDDDRCHLNALKTRAVCAVLRGNISLSDGSVGNYLSTATGLLVTTRNNEAQWIMGLSCVQIRLSVFFLLSTATWEFGKGRVITKSYQNGRFIRPPVVVGVVFIFYPVIYLFLPTFLSATLGTHWTKLNRNLPRVRKWV